MSKATLPIRHFARARLRQRILAWFLVLSLVPLFLSNTVGYLVTTRILERQVRRYLTALAQVEAQHIAAEVERHQLQLEALVGAGGVRTPLSASSLEGASAALVAELYGLSDLFVLDARGRVAAATRDELIGADWSNSRPFRIGRQGRFLTDDWSTIEGVPGPVYLLATPIRTDAGESVGVLVGSVDVERLPGFLRIPPHLAEDVHTYVISSTGFPVIVPHTHRSFRYDEPFKSPLVRLPEGSAARYANYEGLDVLAVSVAVPGLPWLYLAEQPIGSAFGQLRTLAFLAGGLEAGFVLLLVTTVWIVARSLISPLRDLVAAAEHIRSGELGVQVPVNREDELGELGHTFNDMSRALERSARQIQEMHDQEMRRAAQLASVGELASGVAHEIKNPLAGVSGGIDLLAQDLEDTPRTRNVLEQIHTQLRRMESAIRDLLSYARPKEPRVTTLAVGDLVHRATTLVRHQADAAHVRIVEQLDPTATLIRVDPEQMTQALVNLALNGIQAMASGGTLTVSGRSEGPEVHITVADTGPGFPMEHLGTIFRPFYTTKHRGTGLGLAITRDIVERHGGRIETYSEPDAGAEFKIVLTAAARKESPR